MKRRAAEDDLLEKRAKLHALFSHRPSKERFERDNAQPGRFRKKKPLDCGNVQCRVCHGDKYPKRELSRQEETARVADKETV